MVPIRLLLCFASPASLPHHHPRHLSLVHSFHSRQPVPPQSIRFHVMPFHPIPPHPGPFFPFHFISIVPLVRSNGDAPIIRPHSIKIIITVSSKPLAVCGICCCYGSLTVKNMVVSVSFIIVDNWRLMPWVL